MAVDPDAAIPAQIDDVDTHPIKVGARILVVDDVPANLLAAEAALGPLGRDLVMASSGQDALGHLLDGEFALVILDVQMPEMDGYETARWIRSRPKTEHLPIIFITAHDHDQAAVLRGYQLGAVDYLFKPVIAEVLRAKASVFVSLYERTGQLATERLERHFENRRRDYETASLRRQRDRELLANAELARLNTALAEHDRRKDDFLAILAHELRNPLAPLQSYVDIVAGDPSQAASLVGVVERQTSILVRLVDDLLDVSRIKADKIELRPDVVDLRAVVASAIETSRPLIAARKHALEVTQPESEVRVIADTVRLGQVVCNLLRNAARYTEPGGRIATTVEVGAEGEVCVRVEDNGIGIPPELLPTIFDMFVQERVRSDGSGGLGLGLTLSRRLIELHNGTLACRSEGRGKGSAFEIRLPLLGSARSVLPRRRTVDMAPLSRPAVAVAKVAVIDDNEDARELVAQLLRSEGYEIVTASDGAAGLALLVEHRPDVALVDIGLPLLDGFGLAEAVRRDHPEVATKLIALTGYGQKADRERSERAGFQAHLVKPASAPVLRRCVAEQLGTPASS